jgi:outer membrane lipoprotein-sorting protein
LPARTAAQLLTAVMNSADTSFSGTVRETADLGIPSLPGGRSSASLSWQTFIAGSHSARVWSDGPDKQRVALIGELSEADVVHNGADVWTYTSDSNTVTHSIRSQSTQPSEPPSAADVIPAGLAAKVLKAVNPSTKVTVVSTKKVAKHAAYTLLIQPRDARSTVRKVTIAVDATTFVPLRVAVYAKASSPALEVAFTDISFSKPAASTFVFHTPVGATVSKDPFGLTRTPGAHRHHIAQTPDTTSGTASTPSAAHVAPRVIGKDWTSVVEIHGGTQGLDAALSGGTLRELTTPVGSSGDRLLHTALLNALILPDGRAFIGAVQPSLLEQVAASTPN